MVTTLATKEELTALECYDGKTHFKKCSVEYASQHKKEQLSDINGNIIAGSNIKKIRGATGIEFFEHIVYPTLPYEEREIYDSIKSNVPEDKIEKVGIENILFQIEQKRKQEAYYKNAEKEDNIKLKINEYLENITEKEYNELKEKAEKMVRSNFNRKIQTKSYIRYLIKEKILNP